MKTLLISAVVLGLLDFCFGHGRMIDPASRNAMWRFDKFKNRSPRNYNDNEQNCGGFAAQWQLNKGKCGVCGDAYHLKLQPHVHPGKYANGIIAADYVQGQKVEILIDITSNHQGWFEFRVGDIGNPPITQSKLDRILKVIGSKGHPHRYEIPFSSLNQVFKVYVELPSDLLCNHCVLQWWWNTGNSWGCDNTGCGVGKGRQETFVNCADISILPKGTKPKQQTTAKPKMVVTDAVKPKKGKTCKAAKAWRGNPRMDEWCQRSCPLYCPPSHCVCM